MFSSGKQSNYQQAIFIKNWLFLVQGKTKRKNNTSFKTSFDILFKKKGGQTIL